MFTLVGLGGSAQYCDICGNDFEENPGGLVVQKNNLDPLHVCSKHVPKGIQLGQTFDKMEEILINFRYLAITIQLPTFITSQKRLKKIPLFSLVVLELCAFTHQF